MSLGAVYGLIALGYTMVYGVLRFINFAHSEVFMVGAFAAALAAPAFPVGLDEFGGEFHPVWAGLACLGLAMVVGAVTGVVIEYLAYRPLRDKPRLISLITAIGVSLFLQNTGQLVFGAAPRPFPNLFPTANFELPFGVVIGSSQVTVMIVTLVLLFALRWIVLRTRLGTAMRAVAFNPVAASLVGINIGVVVSFTFALGSALGAAGGVLYALNFPSIDPLMGLLPGLKGFIAAILGGIGNIPGAALGGLLLGVVETFVNGSAYSTYTDAIAFAVLIVLLLFRPAGLLGRHVPEKV